MLSKVLKHFLKNKHILSKIKVSVGEAYRLHYEYPGAYWKIRRFSGLCVSVVHNGLQSRVTLANIINGVRVEYSFYLYGAHIIDLEHLSIKKFKKLRRSKLFFLRSKKPSLSRI